MDIETSNAIKLFFPNPSLVQVFFEAVANALDSDASEITIKIEIQGFTAPETLKISITDNGNGFTDDSFERFRRLLKPQDSFHKGLGRLVFLNYFTRVAVDSAWGANRRTFVFSESFQGENKLESVDAAIQPHATTLVFNNFTGKGIKSYDDLKPGPLKERIIEQFLPTLHERSRAQRAFAIKIDLQTQESNAQKEFFSSAETITSADLPELTAVTIADPLLDAYEGVEMFYRIKSGMGERTLLTAVNIDGRTIPIKLLQPGAVPVDHSCIFLFFSKLFEGKADTSRQKLDLPEIVSEADLLRVLRREVGKVLAEQIPQIGEKNTQTKERFETKFPHLLGLFEETTVGLIDKDEALEIAQRRFFKAQKELLESESLDDAGFEKSLDISSRTLTEYILYRELIIKKLGEMDFNNKEADIHNLVVPRRHQYHKDGLLEGIYSNNAWLLDDKFMTFTTILSEATMQDVISAVTLGPDAPADQGRPDISMIFSADPKSNQAVDVVVIEIKRKTDDDKDNTYAATQLVKRARKLVDHCPNIQRMWYYGIVQIDDALATLLKDMKWTPLFSKARVFYQDFEVTKRDGTKVPTPICLLSFDAIINDAACRNHTFLEILKKDLKERVAEKNTPSATPTSV
jgi:hypothetical protein